MLAYRLSIPIDDCDDRSTIPPWLAYAEPDGTRWVLQALFAPKRLPAGRPGWQPTRTTYGERRRRGRTGHHGRRRCRPADLPPAPPLTAL